MDFRGLTGCVLTHEEDPVSGELTVTLQNLAETATIGTIILEPQKLQALADSLAELSRQILLRRADTPYRRRTVYLKNDAYGKMEFFT